MSQTAPHQALYRRWRAQTFGQIVGQEAVVETLRNAVRTGRVAHAILFVGPRGTGKTSLARILAKALNCTNLQDGDPCDACPSCVAIREGRAMDLVEIDAASNRGIDAIRELRERINYAASDLRRKVYILDEAHQITKDAWNALLKSLEEPPDFVAFMFASTHPQDFPPAILSRLQRFDVRRLARTRSRASSGASSRRTDERPSEAATHLIARLAAGGMRDAESMLDQLLASSGIASSEGRVRDLLGLADAETVEASSRRSPGGDVVAGVRILDALEDRGRVSGHSSIRLSKSIRGAMVGRTGARAPGLPQSVVSSSPLPGASPRSTPTAPGSGGCACSSSSCSFPAAVGRAFRRSRRRRSPGPAHEPSTRCVVAGTGRRPRARPNRRKRRVRGRGATGGRNPAAASGNRRRPRAAGRGSAASDPGAPRWPAIRGPPGSLVGCRRPDQRAPPDKPLISVCRPIAVEDGIVTLGFPEDQGFLRAVAERRRRSWRRGSGPCSAARSRSAAWRRTSTWCRPSPPTRTRPSSWLKPDGSSARTGPRPRRSTERRCRHVRSGRVPCTPAEHPPDCNGPTDEPSGARPMGMANLQRMAMQMQQEMARIQAELGVTEIEDRRRRRRACRCDRRAGAASASTIDPGAVDPADVEMLQDLVVAAGQRRPRVVPSPVQSRRWLP